MGDCGHVQDVLWDVQRKDQRWERGGTSTRKWRGGEQEAVGRLLVGLSSGQARSAQSALSLCQTLFELTVQVLSLFGLCVQDLPAGFKSDWPASRNPECGKTQQQGQKLDEGLRL